MPLRAFAGSVDEGKLTPTAEMLASGPGISLMAGPRFLINAAGVSASDASSTVIVHAALGPDGSVLEEEVSSSGDPRLSQTALDLVKQHPFPRAAAQREVYVTVELASANQ